MPGRQLIHMILENKFNPAWVTFKGGGTEWTRSIETMTAMRDGNRGPVSATKNISQKFNSDRHINTIHIDYLLNKDARCPGLLHNKF